MFYCPTCEPDYAPPAAGPVASVAWCEAHSPTGGDRHYLDCPRREPEPDLPPEGGSVSGWIRRRRALERRK